MASSGKQDQGKTAGAETIARLVKLLGLQKELHDKLEAVRIEMDEILAGRASIGAKMKHFMLTFDALWCQRYKAGADTGYVWQGHRDAPQVKRLLTAIGAEELEARAQRYIRDNDPFYVRTRHSFGAFVQAINNFVKESTPAEPLELDAPQVFDCRHTPRCRSDQEHTSRRHEVRA